MADSPTKRCRCCDQELPRADFYRRSCNKDGLYSYCRACTNRKGDEFRASRPDWKEHKASYDRARCDQMREQIAAKGRDWYNRNKDAAIAAAKSWTDSNPEKRRIISQNYKHRRRAQERSGMTGADLIKWQAAQPKCCYWCGDRKAKLYTVDHYVPLSKGGAHEAHNLVIACKPCNLRKNAKDPLDFAREVGRLL